MFLELTLVRPDFSTSPICLNSAAIATCSPRRVKDHISGTRIRFLTDVRDLGRDCAVTDKYEDVVAQLRQASKA